MTIQKLSPEVEAFHAALVAAVPLLSEYYPPEFIDFRSPVPKALRTGLFVRVRVPEYQSAEEEAKYPEGRQYFSAKFASEIACHLAVRQINFLVGHKVAAPKVTAPSEGEGWGWRLTFGVADEDLVEISAAIAPAPPRADSPSRLTQVSESDLKPGATQDQIRRLANLRNLPNKPAVQVSPSRCFPNHLL